MEIISLRTIEEQFEAGKKAFYEHDYDRACNLLRLAVGNIQERPNDLDIIYWLEKAELCRRYYVQACFYQDQEFYEEAYEYLKELHPFVEEVEWAWNMVQKDIYLSKMDDSGKYGYVGLDGGWRIDPIFDKAYSFKEGHARVRVDEKFGFINRKGILVVDTIYDDADDFQNGIALVKLNLECFVINRLGTIIEQVVVDE